MKKNCTTLVMAAAATSVLALGGMVYADQASMTAPGRAMPQHAPTPVGGQPIIWDNGGPDGSNGLSHFEGNLTGTPYNREVADDMVTGDSGSGGWQVVGVQMSGVWFAGASAPGPLTALRVRIWNDAGGEPGTVHYDATVGFTATNTGGVYFDRPEVSYTAAVDVVLADNTTYWVGIQPVGTTDNFFHLTSAAGAGVGSCAGFCNQQSPDGCWCDETCCGAGDCCPDKFSVCGGCDPGSSGGEITGEEAMIRGDFDPVLPNWTPGSVVFGEPYDMTFKLFGFPAESGDCPGDINDDGVVDVSDLLALLGAWGPNPGHPADINEDGVVDVSDLLALLGAWGPCPGPPTPTGACCFEDGSCVADLTADECDDIDGNYNGNFSTCGSCPQPPNGESCGEALELGLGQTIEADTTGNPSPSAPACGGLVPGSSPAIWFAVEGNGNWLQVQADTGAAGPGSSVAVYCNECSNLVCVGGGTQNSEGTNPFDGQVSWCSAADQTYFVVVWRSGGAGEVDVTLTQIAGSCTPTIECEPPAASCQGFCNQQHPSGCWCDEVCCGSGDCCDDKTAVCGGCQWPPTTVGACCVDGSCTDDVEAADCSGIHLPGSACADVTCPIGYTYDTGSTTNALGWNEGGVAMWMHRYVVDGGGADVINEVGTSFNMVGGTPGVSAGQIFGVAVFADNGGMPGAVLWQGTANATADAVNTDAIQWVSTGGVNVSGSFFISAWVEHVPGTFPAPMDENISLPGNVFFTGTIAAPFGSFDPANPTEPYHDMAGIGFPSVFLLRAN